MSETNGVVIVGAGLAGAKTAEALRDGGHAGPVVLIGEEQHRPYDRPPLSKDYLQGKSGRDDVFVHPSSWYTDNHVDLRLGTRVGAIDRAGSAVVLDDGSRVPYAHLVLATGSTPRSLTVPGSELGGVLYLRRLEDSERLRDALTTAHRIVVIGGGWIGLEAAAAARAAGVEVTLLEAAALPLGHVLGPEIAPVFSDLHREHGVVVRTGVTVARLVGDDGQVSGVQLDDGEVVPCDVVLVGVGITPEVRLAADSGLTIDNGVLVDEHLVTSDPLVLAVGDVANAWHPVLGRRIRVEHWANALNQPVVAAATILGRGAVYDRLPYFYSDQYDLGMEYTGYVVPDGYDGVVVRGDLASREFVAFWLHDGRVLAGMNVNVWDVTDDIKALIGSGTRVDRDRLADPAVPLSSLST